MNLKKYLQQQAEKEAEAFLTEEDELFIRQLVESDPPVTVAQPQRRRSKKFWAVLGSVVTVIVAAIIIFPSVFVNRGGNDIFYKDLIVEETQCSLEEMQPYVKYFRIEENISSPYRIMLNYDSVSSDKLYYSIEGSKGISNFKFYLVINENYNYDFTIGEDLITHNLSDNYVINYDVARIIGIDGVETNYNGYIMLQTETIYIEYKQSVDIGDMSEQVFFNDIESIIKVKN